MVATKLHSVFFSADVTLHLMFCCLERFVYFKHQAQVKMTNLTDLILARAGPTKGTMVKPHMSFPESREIIPTRDPRLQATMETKAGQGRMMGRNQSSMETKTTEVLTQSLSPPWNFQKVLPVPKRFIGHFNLLVVTGSVLRRIVSWHCYGGGILTSFHGNFVIANERSDSVPETVT